VKINGTLVKIPSERDDLPIQHLHDQGQQVLITPFGLYPEQLYAVENAPIVWTNLTTEPQHIVFVDYPGGRGSGAIMPGHKFSFTFHSPTSIAFHTATGLVGDLNISNWPGAPS